MSEIQLMLPANDPIAAAAVKLVLRFTEEEDLPVRFRHQGESPRRRRKVKEDSACEKRFRSEIEFWKRLVETMLSKIDSEQAWRLINLSPEIDESITMLTRNGDFRDFMDHLILRRDTERCDSSELGGLALMLNVIQREIEKKNQ
jgi:hypothetical protein